MALILHVADAPDDRAISSETLRKAVAWLDYLKPHARRIYHAAASPNVDAARLLLSKIRNGHVEKSFKARDVYRKGWHGLADSEQVRAACFMLADYNYLRIRDNAPSGTGRPPDPAFEINPKAG